MAIAPLIAIALLSAAGRAIALATGGEPFAWLYGMFPPAAVEDNRLLSQWFADHAALTWVHIGSGSVVLAVAPFQFMPWIRQRHLRLHRWSGRVLLLAALPTGLSGLLLQTLSPYGGVLALSAIWFAGVLFLGALVRAYRAIRRGDTVQHRVWMIRMLAVGLGVGAVRVVAVPLILLTGQRPLDLAGVAFWLGFALPVAAGEWWIRATRLAPAREAVPA